MKKINAKIIADSMSPLGHRIVSYILTYPRFIHSELMTHRMFSRNAASSRAIPFNRMVEMVEEDPFIPIAWQKDHKGMQGTEYFTDPNIIGAKIEAWDKARMDAVDNAGSLAGDVYYSKRDEDYCPYPSLMRKPIENTGVTKQIANRLLEPFMWYTSLVTATEYDNFFELRCPKYNLNDAVYFSKKDVPNEYMENSPGEENAFQGEFWYKENMSVEDWLECNTSQAEIHIQALAEAMWDARNESEPKKLEAGEWHIPFGDKFDFEELAKVTPYGVHGDPYTKVKIATARAARLSYMTFDGEIDYTKDIKLHDDLKENKHNSPFEHCARAMNTKEYNMYYKGRLGTAGKYPFLQTTVESKGEGWCNNFRGFIQYRHIIENENK